MPHFKTAFPSKYLQVADLDVPLVVTIENVTTTDVGVGADIDRKLVVTFAEDVKPVVLNLTRAEAIAELAGSEDTDQWPGTRLRVSKGSTSYKGKRVACIAVDAPPKATARKTAPVPVPDDIDEVMGDPESEVL